MAVKFGTDGWRAIIAHDFTFENLNRVTQATTRWIKEKQVTPNGVVIGYDGRFMGRAFSEYAARVFAAMDLPVKLADRMTTTPALSWAALEHKAVSVVITASHNPPEYSGFKIKAPFGGPATPAMIEDVEKQLDGYDPALEPEALDTYRSRGLVTDLALHRQYIDLLRERIDLQALKKASVRIAHDPMYGAAQGVIGELLPGQTTEIHGEYNPWFHDQAPEPILKNLQPLARHVVEHNCSIGIANDGDADRMGLFDENGDFVDSHLTLALLTRYLSQEKGMSGSIIKTFSTTSMLNKQAEKYNLPIETTPIGFKYIADKMVSGNVLLGGEESGGLAVQQHIPERDGLYIGLMVTEMMVASGKPLSRLVQELHEEFGQHHNWRHDLHTTEERKQATITYCNNKELTEVNGKKVIKWEFTDGIKHWMEDGSWLLVRPSGTEPVLRIYSEDDSPDQARSNAEYVAGLVEKM